MTSMQAQEKLMQSPAVSRARAQLLLSEADRSGEASHGSWTVTSRNGSYEVTAGH